MPEITPEDEITIKTREAWAAFLTSIKDLPVSGVSILDLPGGVGLIQVFNQPGLSVHSQATLAALMPKGLGDMLGGLSALTSISLDALKTPEAMQAAQRIQHLIGTILVENGFTMPTAEEAANV